MACDTREGVACGDHGKHNKIYQAGHWVARGGAGNGLFWAKYLDQTEGCGTGAMLTMGSTEKQPTKTLTTHLGEGRHLTRGMQRTLRHVPLVWHFTWKEIRNFTSLSDCDNVRLTKEFFLRRAIGGEA